MKQLDVDVSPPAFVWNPYLTLTLVTFDLDPCDLDLQVPCQIHCIKSLKIAVFAIMTLTFAHDLDTMKVQQHSKFGDPRSNSSRDLNFS